MVELNTITLYYFRKLRKIMNYYQSHIKPAVVLIEIHTYFLPWKVRNKGKEGGN